EANRLRPMRRSVLKSDELRLNDFFPQVRERLIVFGGETMALPIGCVTPALLSDGLASTGAWTSIGMQEARSEAWAVPSPRTAAYRFLQRASSYASHAGGTSLLFEVEQMLPQLTSPPCLRSMSELAAASAPGQLPGYAASAWPIRNSEQVSADDRRLLPQRLRCDPMPGAGEVYNPIAKQWEPVRGEPRRVPLLATNGRLVGVTAATRNAASAFRLAEWLAGTQNARQLSTSSPNAANVRKSLARVADDWTGRGDKELGKQFSAAQAASLSHREALLIPRIIRVDDYLAALDQEIGRAISGEASPVDALAAAAAEWDRLTDEIGRDRQRRCYQAHLAGLGG
ncbi:MAG: hypothetical protein AAGG46_13070, partial [Planctomycetota bacterium]